MRTEVVVTCVCLDHDSDIDCICFTFIHGTFLYLIQCDIYM